LHADKRCPAIAGGHIIQHGKLPAAHGTSTDVTDFTVLDEVVKCFHGLLRGDRRIEAMDLQEIDEWGLKTGEGRVDSVEDCSTRKARLVNVLGQLGETGDEERLHGRIMCDKAIALCGNYDLGPRNVVLWSSYIKL
jgi:hypothetical protein